MKKAGNSKRVARSRSGNWEFFDDCGICQAMKNAEKQDKSLSIEELKDAFKKQNDNNPWLKKLINKPPK